MTHRVVYAMMNALDMEDVPAEIDHKDNNCQNSAPDNLRPAEHSQNLFNIGAHRDNRSGYKGVSRDRLGRRWVARISARGLNVNLGTFDTPEEAHEAYVSAANDLHGKFARAA